MIADIFGCISFSFVLQKVTFIVALQAHFFDQLGKRVGKVSSTTLHSPTPWSNGNHLSAAKLEGIGF